MIIETDLNTIFDIKQKLPEFHQAKDLSQLQSRVGDTYLALAYKLDDSLAGFKLGYALDSDTFYSWIGGVLPQHRKKGIAKQLLSYQESWCESRGYKSIRVKSTNLFRPMLLMLIKNKYNIIGTEHSETFDTTKILFSKDLQSDS